MCVNQNEQNELQGKNTGRKAKPNTTPKAKQNKPSEEIMTINELLSAISENEYPQYILEAIKELREWMNDAVTKQEKEPNESDIFAKLFGMDFDDDNAGSIEALYERLNKVKEYANVMPDSGTPGKADTIIVSLAPSDYESGLRSAIDYAAVFNKSNCRRVWILSDTFVLDEIVKFSPHVDALASQGITLRYILVTPWGWVELPLSGNTALTRQFLWQTQDEEKQIKRRRKK